MSRGCIELQSSNMVYTGLNSHASLVIIHFLISWLCLPAMRSTSDPSPFLGNSLC